MIAVPFPPTFWQRWRSGFVASSVLHGGVLLALTVTLSSPDRLDAPPSFAVEMVNAPNAAESKPTRPRLNTQPSAVVAPTEPARQTAPVQPAASNDFNLPPPTPERSPLPSPSLAMASPIAPLPPAAAAAAPAAARPASSSLDASAQASWESEVLSRLEAAKRYPASARFAHEEGSVQVRFEVDRAGRIIRKKLLVSSGMSDLDAEATALLGRVRLPPPPSGMSIESITLTVPIAFSINQN